MTAKALSGGGLCLVLGGARSGKSAYAERRAAETGLDKVYVATSEAYDEEMRERIARHKAMRAEAGWHTIEEPLALAETLAGERGGDRVILLDCLTLWVTNLMMADRDVEVAASDLVDALSATTGQGPLFLVSNEVGLGIVPDNAMARAFRDHAGRLHQRLAAIAEEVVFVAAGLPMTLKG